MQIENGTHSLHEEDVLRASEVDEGLSLCGVDRQALLAKHRLSGGKGVVSVAVVMRVRRSDVDAINRLRRASGRQPPHRFGRTHRIRVQLLVSTVDLHVLLPLLHSCFLPDVVDKLGSLVDASRRYGPDDVRDVADRTGGGVDEEIEGELCRDPAGPFVRGEKVMR